jgi:hypothetical protein
MYPPSIAPAHEYRVNSTHSLPKTLAMCPKLPISPSTGGDMKLTQLILMAGLALAPVTATAQDDVDPLAPRAAEGLTLAEFQWLARPVVVFADTPADPRFIEQMELLTERAEALLERDVVIIVDTDPSARSDIRTELRPRGFSIVVLSKDGTVGMRRPAPRDVREIVRAIDNFQLRQEELRRGE